MAWSYHNWHYLTLLWYCCQVRIPLLMKRFKKNILKKQPQSTQFMVGSRLMCKLALVMFFVDHHFVLETRLLTESDPVGWCEHQQQQLSDVKLHWQWDVGCSTWKNYINSLGWHNHTHKSSCISIILRWIVRVYISDVYIWYMYHINQWCCFSHHLQ